MSPCNRPRLPDWIRVRPQAGPQRQQVGALLKNLGLNTVCHSAGCPNLGECWHAQTATFMILGNYCTRNCKFCGVEHQKTPAPLDLSEPERVAEAAKKLNLSFVVVTSVTRDDLPDGGAELFAQTIRILRQQIPSVKIEVLTPDFKGNETLLSIIADSKPDVFNHNIETVRRMTPLVRNVATYETSLKVLKWMSQHGDGILVKTGLIVGMGETDQEVLETLKEVRAAGVSILTIGQYLPPSNKHWQLDRYVHPNVFEQWKEEALKMGFSQVASGPLVRSSYQAHRLAAK